MLTTDEIHAKLAYEGPPATKAGMLINRANDAGGIENIAVTLAGIIG